MEKIYQCCYTNAVSQSGGIINSEWKAVRSSYDIPGDALLNCTALQNLNCPDCANMVDEEGRILNQYELITDKKYVYVMRTQYGLVDRVGRPNMFSHAYIVPFHAAVLRDPASFLAISNQNFITDVTDFKDEQNLVKDDPFQMDTALSHLSMTMETYCQFIKCLYFQLEQKRITTPLYVLYDGTDRSMKALIYLAYYGIPFHLRKNMRMASSAMGGKKASKHLVFTKDISNKPFYIDPKTGDNNLLTPRIEKRIDKLGYITYPFLNTTDLLEYFSDFHENTLLLSDTDASNKLILKISYQMLFGPNIESLSSDELVDILADSLYSPSKMSEDMESYMAQILKVIEEKKIILHEECEMQLIHRWRSAISDIFRTAAEQYIIHRLDRMDTEAALKKLEDLPMDVFSMYETSQYALGKENSGLLKVFYRQQLSESLSWEDLRTFMLKVQPLHDNDLNEEVCAVAQLKYKAEVNQHHDSLIAYDQLIEISELLHQDASTIEMKAKQYFWEQFQISNYLVEPETTYEALKEDTHPNSVLCFLLKALIDDLKDAQTQVLNYAYTFFSKCKEYDIAKKEKDLTFELISTTLIHENHANQKLEEWLRLSYQIANNTTDKGYIELLSDIMNAIYTQKYTDVQCLYAEFSTNWKEDRSISQIVLQNLSSLLLQICETCDALQIVPLDVWLILASDTRGNPFCVFDEHKKARVLEKEAKEVVQESSLLCDHEFFSYATEYVHKKDKDSAYKIVKKWVTEMKNETKKENDETPGKKGKFDALSKIFKKNK